MPMKLRIGAAFFDLQVATPNGKSTYDLSKMSAPQLEGAREMIVNYWCRENGFPEPYARAA